MKFGKMKDILILITKNFFKIRQELTELWPFKNWYFCDRSSRTKLIFLWPLISIPHNLLRGCVFETIFMQMDSLKLIISWIWGWKITHAWPNFEPI